MSALGHIQSLGGNSLKIAICAACIRPAEVKRNAGLSRVFVCFPGGLFAHAREGKKKEAVGLYQFTILGFTDPLPRPQVNITSGHVSTQLWCSILTFIQPVAFGRQYCHETGPIEVNRPVVQAAWCSWLSLDKIGIWEVTYCLCAARQILI